MTMMLIEGLKCERKYEKTKELPNPDNFKSADEKALMALIAREIPKNGKIFRTLASEVEGISEETTTGVLRLNQLSESG
jgi:adenosylhomocysteinase